MKKLLLLFACIASVASAMSQSSSNTCSEALSATHITTEGSYTVGDINGTASTLNCVSAPNANNAEWFAYTPSANFNVTITSDLVINGNKDTRIHVYSGSCDNLTCVAGDDDSGVYNGTNSNSYLSIVTFNVVANQTYFIAWDNRWSDSSNFSFEVIETTASEPSQRTFSSQSISTSGTRMGVADMNGDFLDDIITIPGSNGNYNLNIYYQQANGTFVTGNYFPGANRSPTWSLAAGDFDGNGYNDIVFGDSSGCNVIRANANGTAYTTVANNSVFTQRTNFADINNDGHLDIFVCHDVAPSVYYLSDGSGGLTFFQSVANVGLGSYPSGGNYGSVWIDYDNDRDIDMFMAKCGGDVPRRTNEMYRNNGSGNYVEVGEIIGLDDPIQTWSSAWADFNNDGYMDCFIGTSDGSPHKMMLNVPNPNTGDTANPRVFVDVTSTTGLSAWTSSSIEHAPADFDNDGYVDILSGGSVLYNNGDMTFTAVTTNTPGQGGIGDLNNDGFLDVYGNGSSIRINDGNANNWIKIITIGDEAGGYSNRNGIGARVEIVSNLGTQIRDVRSGEGFRYMSTLNTHFGIGQDTQIDYIKIYWPSGIIDQINNPTINSTITVPEGSNTLGSDDTFVSDLIIYPNPTKNVLNLSTLQDLNDAIYSVFDLNGRRVLNAILDSKTIDVSSLISGQYILRIVSGSSVKNQKFIKQ
uniref:FG-GAP-like repeat-containing protein n=2 Tax=Gelidibacter sp. TaxID=2018083 RepID=UPI00404B7A09